MFRYHGEKKKRKTSTAFLFSLVSGYVNVLGLLVMGDVFLSFMSGNSTRLGVHLALGEIETAARYITVVIGFIGGAFLGDILVSLIKQERLLVVLTCEIVLLGLSLGLHYTDMTWGAYIPLTIAMGVQNNTQITVGDTIIGKTFVSGVLYSLGTSLSQAIQRKQSFVPTILCGLSWLCFVLGGFFGTLMVVMVDVTSAIILLTILLSGLLVWISVLEYTGYGNNQSKWRLSQKHD